MLEIIRHDAVVEYLARPPVRPFDVVLSRTLREAIEGAPKGGARGLLISGRVGMFSRGARCRHGAAARPGRQARRSMARILGIVPRDCPSSRVPVVAAITGHCPAGGAVLATFCDYRVMARSADPAKPFRIGLNETQVGLVVPAEVQTGLRRLVGAYRAERLMVAGAMVDSEEALRIGFVDELAEPEQVVSRARAWLSQLLALPPGAMNGTRRIARAIVAEFDAHRSGDVDEFVRGLVHRRITRDARGRAGEVEVEVARVAAPANERATTTALRHRPQLAIAGNKRVLAAILVVVVNDFVATFQPTGERNVRFPRSVCFFTAVHMLDDSPGARPCVEECLRCEYRIRYRNSVSFVPATRFGSHRSCSRSIASSTCSFSRHVPGKTAGAIDREPDPRGLARGELHRAAESVELASDNGRRRPVCSGESIAKICPIAKYSRQSNIACPSNRSRRRCGLFADRPTCSNSSFNSTAAAGLR